MKVKSLQLKIGGRLLLGFLVVVGLTMLVGVLGISKMSTLADLTEKLYRHPYAVSTAVRDIKADITAMDRSMKDVALAQTNVSIDAAAQVVESYGVKVLETFDLLADRFLGNPATISGARQLFVAWEPIRAEVIQHMKSGNRRAAVVITQGLGRNHLAAIEASIEGIISFASAKGEEFNAGAIQTRLEALNFMLLLLALAVFSGGIIAVVITRSITRPINDTIAILEDIEQGDGDLTKRLNSTSVDEIGVMGRLFDSLLEMIQGLMINVAGSADTVNDLARKIANASEEFASSAEEQQSQLLEVATTVEQMSAMVEQSSRSADRTRESTEQTARLAEDGRESVSKTVKGFESVASTVVEAAARIKSLSTRSEEIGQVIQVIEDIADQTNLLALNANIEAARAGDAGRGFAVVADEVRKLAERTVNATMEIGDMIKTIQKEVDGAVQYMDTVQGLSDNGLILVETSDRALVEIAQGIQIAATAVDEIATAANEQSSGVEQVSKNLEHVSALARETSSNAVTLSGSASELNGEVKELNALIAKFKI